MVFDRWARWTPLTGVLFVVLVLVGGPVLAQSAPGATASSASVISFYSAHRGRERAGAVVIALAFVAFLFFAATLRSRFRRTPGQEGLSALILAAATVLVVGQSADAGITYAITEAPARLSASAAQVLNLLQNDLVVTSAIGFLSFGLAAGITIIRGADLPTWLGIAAMLIGVLFLTPLEFVAFLLLLVWIAVVSVMLIRSYRGPATAAAPDHPSPAGALP
jgi:hypothetical protein